MCATLVSLLKKQENSSVAKDICNQATKKIKELGKLQNFISWITKLWNAIVEDGSIPNILKRDKIIYLWKKKGSREDPKILSNNTGYRDIKSGRSNTQQQTN